MKKNTIFIFVLILFVVVSLICLNKKTNFQEIINSSVIYIESVSDETINNCSGFVYDINDNNAYIVTAYHCVDNVNEIYVYNMSKEKEKAIIDTYDLNNDIAILSIENNLSLKKIKISNKVPNVGNEIFVIGTPLDINYSGTLTHGVVSYVDRKVSLKKENGIVTYNTIQIDAPISGGNSGSVLVDSKGKAVGMVIIKDDNLDGISFAIPINKVIELKTYN